MVMWTICVMGANREAREEAWTPALFLDRTFTENFQIYHSRLSKLPHLLSNAYMHTLESLRASIFSLTPLSPLPFSLLRSNQQH